MFCSGENFAMFEQETLCIYNLRDKLLSLQKIGCTPRILNALNIAFDADLTLTEVLEEFPSIEGLVISSDIDGRQLRGMRKLTQLKSLFLGMNGDMQKNEIRLPKQITSIHILPMCIISAGSISGFLQKSLSSNTSEKVTIILDRMDLVYGWEEMFIPKTVERVVCTKRRNLPQELRSVFKNSGLHRGERTENAVIYERGLENFSGTDSPPGERERIIDEVEMEELIIKITTLAFGI